MARLAPLYAAIWLVFLIDPFRAAWDERTTASGALGIVLLVAFAAAYVLSLAFPPRWGFTGDLRRSRLAGAAWVAALVLLAAGVVATLGEVGLGTLVYVVVVAVAKLEVRASALVALALLGTLVVHAISTGAQDSLGSLLGICVTIVAIYGVRSMIRRNRDLVETREMTAALAAANERNRLARDLHDVLGHSLTVIAIKAELAQRLLDVDPERARAEVADLHRLSRDALTDVRHAVAGYRELSLPEEIARAREALRAAGVTAVLPRSTEMVTSDLREPFAWVVREGVTNVVRHSAAGRCEVVLTSCSVRVRDDGAGRFGRSGGGEVGAARAVSEGSGLTGLRERAAACGATVSVRRLEPGFELEMSRS